MSAVAGFQVELERVEDKMRELNLSVSEGRNSEVVSGGIDVSYIELGNIALAGGNVNFNTAAAAAPFPPRARRTSTSPTRYPAAPRLPLSRRGVYVVNLMFYRGRLCWWLRHRIGRRERQRARAVPTA